MIKDHELLEALDPFQGKRFILWGAGREGRALAEKMRRFTSSIEFVDSDEAKVREGVQDGILVSAPSRIAAYDPDEIGIVITPDDVRVQESILDQIAARGFQDIDVYTKFAVEAVMCFQKKGKTDGHTADREQELAQRVDMQEKAIKAIESRLKLMERMLLIGAADRSAFVYQSKKVASVTIVNSIRSAGGYGFHVHDFAGLCLDRMTLRNFIKRSSGKVVSIVREPIARQISLLWYYWGMRRESFLSHYDSLEGLERDLYSIPNKEDEFEWYRKELEPVLGIDVYSYPFDRESGYTVIDKDGISLLLLKMEKIGTLERVIGDFLEIEDFRLLNANVAHEKKYRYAYQDYLEKVRIPSGFYEHYHKDNPYMDHFYSESEKERAFERWKDHIV